MNTGYLDQTLSPEKRAEILVNEMTAEEAAGQLRYDAPAIERLGIPAYNWWNEGLHGLARSGTATMFPQAIGLAAMFDPELMEKAAEITSKETRAKYTKYTEHGDRDIFKGLTLWSPNINIFRDPRWGRGQETFGEDPYLTAEYGKAAVKGFQGSGKTLRAAACAKHFAVHSGPEKLRHEFDAKATPRDMEETYLPAFEALVKEAKVEGVMGAYNRVNGEPACASDFLMEKLKQWGFDGYFVSDCWAIQDFHMHHHITADPVHSAAMALNAGCDVNCGCTYALLLTALEQGLVTEEQIRKACVHLMRTRIRLGLFDKDNEWDIPYSYVSCPENKAVSLECSERSIVMLENNGILPLDENKIKTLAVIGPVADSRAVLEGNYCGRADRYITFLEGIQDRFGGQVMYAEGCHMFKDRISYLAQAGDRYAEAEIAAENADAVILCLGLDATLEGEEGDTGNEFSSGDRPDLRLPAPQRELLSRIMNTGKPVIVVCTGGGGFNIEQEPSALIHAFYPGQMGGKALAEILFGDISPSGKLPVTFYKTAELLPDFTDYSMENRTYRRLLSDENVLYPFGYGLTYSKVCCDDIKYDKETSTVTLTAENIGDRQTEDVIQLYIKDSSQYGTPNASLCGFKRINLQKGEKLTVQIHLPERAFTSVNEKGDRQVFGKEFTLYAGTRQPESGDVGIKITLE